MISSDEASVLYSSLHKEILEEIKKNGRLIKSKDYSDLEKVMKWHRFLWNWIALRIAIDKDISDKRALKRLFFETYFMKMNTCWPNNLCFICEASLNTWDFRVFCEPFSLQSRLTNNIGYRCLNGNRICPVKWTENNGSCVSQESPFETFRLSTDVEEAYKAAIEVAEIKPHKEYLNHK